MKTAQLKFTKISELSNYLKTSGKNANTISAAQAEALVSKEGLKDILINQVTKHKGITRDDSIIFLSLYYQEHHLFIALLKAYIKHMGFSCMFQIKDKYGFNLMHKVAYTGNAEHMDGVLDLYKKKQTLIHKLQRI